MRNIWPFLTLVWQASPALMLVSMVLRLVRAVLPVAALWIGKLIIDEVVRLSALPDRPADLWGWWNSDALGLLITYVLAEFALAILSDVLGRVVGLVDTLLSDRLTMSSSIRLMEHAATLDLEDFEDAEFQDKLERARRQASGRMTLMGLLFTQMQNLVTVATFAAGLVIFNPWLILLLALALIPAFIGEAHFNAQSYSLDFGRTPERRELDYVRQTAASVESAKEVKIFGLNGFLTDRYRVLSESFYAASRKIAQKRAHLGWRADGAWHAGLLCRLCLDHRGHVGGAAVAGRSDVSVGVVPAPARLAGRSADLVFLHRSTGAVSRRSVQLL